MPSPSSLLSPKLPANAKLPGWALSVLGAGKLPWGDAKFVTENLAGLWGGGVFKFDTGTSHGPVVLAVNDADIDADGPGGSREVDPDWQMDTSLHFANGSACNSRVFPGVVVPPVFMKAPLGVRMGDFGVAVYHDGAGRIVVHRFQVYDQGPTRKLGEISLYLGRLMGIVPPNVSDHVAATKGNSVADLVTIFFCGSGPGHALPSPNITQYGSDLYAKFLQANGCPASPLV